DRRSPPPAQAALLPGRGRPKDPRERAARAGVRADCRTRPSRPAAYALVPAPGRFVSLAVSWPAPAISPGRPCPGCSRTRKGGPWRGDKVTAVAELTERFQSSGVAVLTE